MRTCTVFLITTCSVLIMQSCSLPTHTRSVSPYFSGSLKYNEQPVKNARIMLSISANDSLCFKAIETTLTSEEGLFSLKPASEEHTYKPFLNYKFDEWFICAKYNNQRYTLHSNNRYSANSNAEALPTDCGPSCANPDDQQNNFYYDNPQNTDDVSGSVHLECDLALRPMTRPCVVTH
ncbi:hypothetical protein MNBD_GAMMA11-3285 [hydrothermal vent metagenome]|uniref:DUF6795 domain-containing protein n=1 Tax=hydrothermal vent metagenome TaxID=652676 RepID=A0A3B0XXX1_9ZZZZ